MTLGILLRQSPIQHLAEFADCDPSRLLSQIIIHHTQSTAQSQYRKWKRR